MAEFPPHVLREYALIADGERGALIGPRGDITWMCAPRWHSGAVFATLIGGGGVYAVTPVELFVWGGYYEAGSLIWRSHWITADGRIECREALAMPGDAGTAAPGPARRIRWWGVFLIGLGLWILSVIVTAITGNINTVPSIVLLGSFEKLF